MSEDRIRELLTSPLEPDPPSSGSVQARHVPTLWWFLAAMVAGGSLVALGYLVARPGAPGPVAAETTTTTVPSDDDGSEQVWPPGFADLHDPFGGRVERVLARPDGVFVTISTVVMAGVDGIASAPFPGGAWSLVLADGTRVASTDEISDPHTPGYLTIRFVSDALGSAVEVEALEYTAVCLRATDTWQTGAVDVALPGDGSEIQVILDESRFRAGDAANLVIGDLRLSQDGGTLTWHLDGDGDRRGFVDVALSARIGDRAFFFTTRATGQGFSVFGGPGLPPLTFPGTLSSEGEVMLHPQDGPPIETDVPAALDLTIFVTAASCSETYAWLPLGDAAVVRVGG